MRATPAGSEADSSVQAYAHRTADVIPVLVDCATVSLGLLVLDQILGRQAGPESLPFWAVIAIVVGLRLLALALVGSYRRPWASLGGADLLRLLAAVTLSSSLLLAGLATAPTHSIIASLHPSLALAEACVSSLLLVLTRLAYLQWPRVVAVLRARRQGLVRRDVALWVPVPQAVPLLEFIRLRWPYVLRVRAVVDPTGDHAGMQVAGVPVLSLAELGQLCRLDRGVTALIVEPGASTADCALKSAPAALHPSPALLKFSEVEGWLAWPTPNLPPLPEDLRGGAAANGAVDEQSHERSRAA